MADVFISYDREDRAKAQLLHDALTAHGFKVWWDQMLVVGEDIRERIKAELNRAEAVIVIWASRQHRSNWVPDEAVTGKNRRKLFPVTFEAEIRPPKAFAHIQVMTLAAWTGDPHAREMEILTSALRRPREAAQPQPALHSLGEDGGFLGDLTQNVGGIPYPRFVRGSAVMAGAISLVMLLGLSLGGEATLAGALSMILANLVAVVLIRGFHQFVVYAKNEAEHHFFDRDFCFWIMVALFAAVVAECVLIVIAPQPYDANQLILLLPVLLLIALAVMTVIRVALTVVRSVMVRLD